MPPVWDFARSLANPQCGDRHNGRQQQVHAARRRRRLVFRRGIRPLVTETDGRVRFDIPDSRVKPGG